MSKKLKVRIKEIFGADVYRDGGSYGFFFHAYNGSRYEFFIQRDLDGATGNDYYEPQMFLEGVNSNNVVFSFSWKEALKFVQDLEYENERFTELKRIVENGGNFT